MLPRYVSLTIFSRLENEAPLNLSHREGDLLKHKVVMVEGQEGLLVKAKRSGNAVKAAHRRGIMEIFGINFTKCNPSTAIGEEAKTCANCQACAMHGYATRDRRRASLFQATDMISVESDVIKPVPTAEEEIKNILSTLEVGLREVIAVEQHLALPPAETEAPTPFRVEKVQAGIHFVNGLLLEVPKLVVEKAQEQSIIDQLVAQQYGDGNYEQGVRNMIKTFIEATTYPYLICFAMESRNRPVFTPLKTLINVTFEPVKAGYPPILMPSVTHNKPADIEQWFKGFEKTEQKNKKAQLLHLVSETKDVNDLRERVLRFLEDNDVIAKA